MTSLRDFAPGYDEMVLDDLAPGYYRSPQAGIARVGPDVSRYIDEIERDDMTELGKGYKSGRLNIEASYLAAEEASLRAEGEQAAADLLTQRRVALEERAAVFAPSTQELTDVLEKPSLRSAGNWLASNAGSLGASMVDPFTHGLGASALARGASAVGSVVAPFTGPAAPFVAGASRLLGAAAPYIGEAAAFVPGYEGAKGGAYRAMLRDPELMARTTDEQRNTAASFSGAGQAALDTLIPGAMRRRLMGENLYGAAERGLNRLPIVAGAALDSLGEGAQEVVQDRMEKAALSYLNPDRNTDEDVKDAINNFGAGLFGSAPMSAATRLAARGRDRVALKTDDKYGDETTVDNGNGEENLKELEKLMGGKITDDNVSDFIKTSRQRFETPEEHQALKDVIEGNVFGSATTPQEMLDTAIERKQALIDELGRFKSSKTAKTLAQELENHSIESIQDAMDIAGEPDTPFEKAAAFLLPRLNKLDAEVSGEKYNAEGISRMDRKAMASEVTANRRDQMAALEERRRSGLDPSADPHEATTYGEYTGGQRDFSEESSAEFGAVHPTTADLKERGKNTKSPIIDPKSFVFDLTPDMFSDIGEISPNRQEDALKGYPKPGQTAKANEQRQKEIAQATEEYNARLSFTARRLHTAANDATPTSFVETNKIAEELQALTTLQAPTSASTRRGMRLADRVLDLVDGDGEVAKQMIYDVWHSSGGSKAFKPVVDYMEMIASRNPASFKVEQKTREDAADEIAKLIPASVQMQLMDAHGIDFGDAQTRDRMLEVMEKHVDGRSGTTDEKLNELFTEPVVRKISDYLGRKIVPRLGGVTWSNVDDDGTVSQQQLSSDGTSLDDDEMGGVLGDEQDTSDYDREGFEASLDKLPPKAMLVPVSGGIRDLKEAWKEKREGGVRSLLSLAKDGHDVLMGKIKERVARATEYLGDEHISYQIGDPGSKDPFERAGATSVSKIMDSTGVAPIKRTQMMLEHMANDGQVDTAKARHAIEAYSHLKRIDEDLSTLIAGREALGPDGGKLSMMDKARTLRSTATKLLALDPKKLVGIIGDKALTALKELEGSAVKGGMETNYLPDGTTEIARARPMSPESFYTRIAPAIHKWTRKAQQNLQQTIPYFDSYLRRNPEGTLDGFTREYFNERYMVVAAQNTNVDHMKMDPVTFEGLANDGARALNSVWTKARGDMEESNKVRASMNLLHFKSRLGDKNGEVAIPAYALVEYARKGRFDHDDVARSKSDSKTPGEQQKEYRDLMMDGITTLIHSGLVDGLPWIHNAKGEREDFRSRSLGAAPGHPQQRQLFDIDRGELPPSLDLGGIILAKHKENMAYGVNMQEKRRAEMGAKKRAELDVMAGLKKDGELSAETFDGQTREMQDESDVDRMAVVGGRDEQRKDIERRTSELMAAADPLPKSMTPGKAVNLAKHVADGLWRDYVSDRARGMQRIFSYVGSMDTIGSGSGKQYAAPLAALLSPANLARAHAEDLDTLLEIRRRAVQALIDLAYPKSGITKIDRSKVRQIANVLSGATDAAIFAKDDKTRKPSEDGKEERARAELAGKALLFGDNREVPISRVESFLKSIASTPTVGLQSQFMTESEAAELAALRPKANITAMDARQRAAIARSLGRLGDIFGHIARPYKFVSQEGKNRGTTYSTLNTIGINFNALRGDERWPADMPLQHRLDWVVSHELGHAHDLRLKINGKPASLGGKSLMPGGWAYNEAEAARKKLPFLDWVYKYALEQPSDDKRARELFAQHIAVMNYNKELLREHLPDTYAALVDSADDAGPPRWSHEGGNRGSGEARVRDGSGGDGSVSGDEGGRGTDSQSREVQGQAGRDDPKTAKEVGRRADGRAVSTTVRERPEAAGRKVETKEPSKVSSPKMGVSPSLGYTPKADLSMNYAEGEKHTPSSPIQAPGATTAASEGVGSQKPAQAAAKDLDATVDKYSKMLDNPPDGFMTAHTEKIKAWAERQYAKLGEELRAETDQKSDRAMELADQRTDLKALANKAGASIEADKHSERQTMGIKYNAETSQAQTQTTPEPLVQNPGKFEKAARTPTSIEVTAAVKAYFAKTLAPKVRVMLQEMFPELQGKGNASWDAENLLAKISTANPTKTLEWAYHEAMHAFFTTVINDKGMKDVRDMLFDVVGDDSKLYARLKEEFKGSPVALEHMEQSKEERVAYAFQLWAADALDIAKKPETFFQKVQALMRHVFGLVSNDEKAMMLFEAFNGGQLKEPSAAGKAIIRIMQTGQWRKNFLAKIDKQFQAVYTEVMANHLVYRTSESETARTIGPMFVSIASYGADKEGAAGMIDKTRMKRGEYSNRIRDVLAGLEGPNLKRDLKALVDALNSHTVPELSHIAEAKDKIHALLDDFYAYSQDAELDLGKQLGADGKFWPRVMDLDKMINGKEAFIAMLVKYPNSLRALKSAVQRANPKIKVTEVEVAQAIYQGIIDRMGNVDPRLKAMREDGVLNPFFASSNERHLDWIKDADMKPFLSEDVVGTMSQYFHQGVRAVEYKRAFGQDGIRLQDMMATKGDLKYVDENGDAVRYDEDGPVRSELVAKGGKEGLRGKKLDAWVDRRMEDLKRANGAMEGSLGKDITAGLRNVQSAAMTYQVVRLLPLMIFSSMLDPNGIRVAGGTADDMFNAYKRGFTGLWNNWKELLLGEAKNRSVDDLERAALDSMVINSDAEIEDIGTVHSSEYMSGLARHINHAFFKAIGITQWDRDMRISATDAARKAIVRDYNNAVPEHSARWLRELGLKREDIYVKDGELIVSPEALAAEKGWSVAEARKKLEPTHFAINRWVNRAIVSPNAGLRPTRASDPHFAMFYQFKSFTYAFQETTMRYALHEAEQGNKTAAFQLMRGIPIMLMADLTKAMVTGGGSLPGYMANWTLADWLSHAINRSGVGGTATFITDALGGNAIGVVAGPTVDHAVTAAGDVLSGNPGHAFVQALPGVRQLAMAGT